MRDKIVGRGAEVEKRLLWPKSFEEVSDHVCRKKMTVQTNLDILIDKTRWSETKCLFLR